MKGITLLCLFVFCSIASANTYYVAPNGSDNNVGTKDKPWKTWGKAFNSTSVNPGDTVYFRGGVYKKNLTDGNDNWYYPARSANGTGYQISRNGTSGNRIYYKVYPGETPILDCEDVVIPNITNYGIQASSISNLYFKGLHIRNVLSGLKSGVEIESAGFKYYKANNVTFDQCVCYSIHGTGFYSENATNVLYKNCDTYDLCDFYEPANPGNDGTGFRSTGDDFTNGSTYFRGCRAWLCGDQGFSTGAYSYTEIDSCWSFLNGRLAGGGHGYKLSFTVTTGINPVRKVTNCIAAFNRQSGMTTNDNGKPSIGMQIYNNTIYHNGYISWPSGSFQGGIKIYNSGSSDQLELARIFRNNVSYDNENNNFISVSTGGLYTHSNNSWDTPGITVSDADFLSVDSTGISGPRQEDGSLPDLKGFLKLKSTSKAVNAGTNVGLTYSGTAPDLGYSEYSGTVVPPTIPIYVSSAIENATPSRLEMTYSLSLTNIVPAASAFAVMVNSTARSISSVAISGTKVLLTLSSPVVYGNTVTVAYTKPSTNPLQTSSGGQAASVNAQSATNRVTAPVPVYVSSAIENATPSRLEMTYNTSLANIVPAASAFAVTVNSTARSVSSVTISGTKVLITLSSPVVYGNVVTVTYTKPATNPLQTTSGGQAASVSAQSVANRVTSPIPVYISSAIENAIPARLEMTYSLALANIVPVASAFVVTVNTTARSVSSVAISGTKVILTLSSPVASGNTVTVAYTKPSANPLQTTSGGQAASITAKSVTNKVDAIVPVYVNSAIENAIPARLEMTYSLSLANFVPVASAFTVTVNSTARSVSSVAISGTKVLLTLSSPVAYGNIVTVAYTKPSANPLQTTSGGQATSITAQTVSNNLLEASKVLGITQVFNSSTTIGNRRAVPVKFSEDGQIESIAIYHNGGTGRILLGVYSDLSGSPSNSLGVTSATTINSSAGWQTVTLISPVQVASGQTVWLSWVFENNPGIRFMDGTPGRAESRGTWSEGMPDIFGSVTMGNCNYSVYCKYSVTGPVKNTSGNTDVFSSTTTIANRRAVPVEFSEGGEIESITIYHNGGTGSLLLGVYSDLSESPSMLLGATSATTINSSAGWQTVTLPNPVPVTSGQTLWLSWVFENNPGIRFMDGAPGRVESKGVWSGGMPDTFGTSTFSYCNYSIYCTYTSTGTSKGLASMPIAKNSSPDIIPSVELNENSNTFKLYPNPNDGNFNIELLTDFADENITVTIVNISGEIVSKERLVNKDMHTQFNLSHLKSGIYIISIACNNFSYAKKFIKK